MRIVAAAVLVIGVLGLVPLASGARAKSASGEVAAQPPPPVIAIVAVDSGVRVEPLDARTLAPIRGSWRFLVHRYFDAPPVAVSPSSTRVAIGRGDGGSVFVLDTVTGRRLRNYGPGYDYSHGLYWLGGDGFGWRGRAFLLIAHGEDCDPGGCDDMFDTLGTSTDDTAFYRSTPIITAFKQELLLDFSPAQEADLYGLGGDLGSLVLPKNWPGVYVADAVNDRLFVISPDGLGAEVDHVGYGRERVTYHSVALSGHPFKAAWAGDGQIAVWGEDGLGTIDTGASNWTTHSIATGVTDAVTTPYGIAAWTKNPADGLTVYRPDGSPRLHLLAGKKILSAQTVGTYLYADDANARYSIDLRTGKVRGPLWQTQIVPPTLTLIP